MSSTLALFHTSIRPYTNTVPLTQKTLPFIIYLLALLVKEISHWHPPRVPYEGQNEWSPQEVTLSLGYLLLPELKGSSLWTVQRNRIRWHIVQRCFNFQPIYHVQWIQYVIGTQTVLEIFTYRRQIRILLDTPRLTLYQHYFSTGSIPHSKRVNKSVEKHTVYLVNNYPRFIIPHKRLEVKNEGCSRLGRVFRQRVKIYFYQNINKTKILNFKCIKNSEIFLVIFIFSGA